MEERRPGAVGRHQDRVARTGVRIGEVDRVVHRSAPAHGKHFCGSGQDGVAAEKQDHAGFGMSIRIRKPGTGQEIGLPVAVHVAGPAQHAAHLVSLRQAIEPEERAAAGAGKKEHRTGEGQAVGARPGCADHGFRNAVAIHVARGADRLAELIESGLTVEGPQEAAGGAREEKGGTRIRQAVGTGEGGADEDVGGSVAVHVSGSGDGTAEVGESRWSVQAPDQGRGRSGIKIGGSRGGQPVGIRLGGSHEEVARSVPVHVAGSRDRGSQTGAFRRTVDPEKKSARCAGEDIGRTGVWNAVGIFRGSSDENVFDPISIQVPGSCDRVPELAVGRLSVELTDDVSGRPREDHRRARRDQSVGIAVGRPGNQIGDAISVQIPKSGKRHAQGESPVGAVHLPERFPGEPRKGEHGSEADTAAERLAGRHVIQPVAVEVSGSRNRSSELFQGNGAVPLADLVQGPADRLGGEETGEKQEGCETQEEGRKAARHRWLLKSVDDIGDPGIQDPKGG